MAEAPPQAIPTAAPGARFRWFHVAPGFIPLALVALAFLVGTPQRLLARLQGSDPCEPNDVLAQAYPVAVGKLANLTCRQADVDWFRTAIPAGKALRVTVTPGPEGTGGVSIHDRRGIRLAGEPISAGGSSKTSCNYTPPGLAAQEVTVRVWGTRRLPYQLEVEHLDPRGRFEPNDQRAQASRVGAGRTEALRCDGRDWFRAEVPAWRTLEAKLNTTSPGLGLHILDAGTSTAQVRSATLPRRAAAPARALPRVVYVEVVGKGDYDLDLKLGPYRADLAERTLRSLPVIRDALEPNQTRQAASRIVPGRYPRQQCNAWDWYSIRVPAKQTLQVDVKYLRRGSGLNLHTSTGRTLLPGLGTQVFSRNEGLQLFAYGLTEGVVLFGLRGHAEYSMTVRIVPGLPGTPLAPGEYPQLVGSGSDLWRIQVSPGQRLHAEVRTRGAEHGGYLNMELRGPVLPRTKRKKQRRGRWGRPRRRVAKNAPSRHIRSAYIDGVGRLTYRASRAEPLFLRVHGTPQRYDLKLTLQGRVGTGKYAPAQARPISAGIFRDLPLRAKGEAIYRILLKKGDALEAAVSFVNEVADIDLEILDSHGQRVARAVTSEDTERLRYTSPADQPAYVRVHTVFPTPSRYDLMLKKNGTTVPVSRPLPDETRNLRCSGNDLFRVPLNAGERLEVQIDFAHAKGDLDLALQAATGEQFLSSASQTNRESLTHTAQGREAVLIRIHGAENTYDLRAVIRRAQ